MLMSGFWRAGAENGARAVTRSSRPFPTQIDRHKGANHFFQFVSRRDDRDSIIITSNQRLGV
jgi:hypothetical protein